MKNRQGKKIKSITAEFIGTGSASISEADVGRMSHRSEEVIRKFRENVPLRKFLTDAVLFVHIVKDYATGKYKAVPWWVIASIVFTMLYVLNPFDLIPEFIPVVGYLDDATAVTILLSLISHELDLYKKWKERNPG